jgi:hypothetical protein
MTGQAVVEMVGKTVIALSGVYMGLLLLRKWQETRSRVVLHWTVFFLATVGYLFGVPIILGWGNPATLTRWQYVFSAAAALPGSLAGTILMLPLPPKLADRLSLWVPLGLFVIIAALLLTSPVEPTQISQGHSYSGLFGTLHLAVLIVAGLISAGTLLYLASRFRDARYVALSVAFLLTVGGLRMMGGRIVSAVLGMVLVVAAYVVFYVVFADLMRTT